MKKMAKAIFMHAITSVHAGSGSSVSYVDLPFQREVNTQFPVIYASEVRGIFRANSFEEKFSNISDFEGLRKAVESFISIFGGGEDVKREIEKFRDEKGIDEEDKLRALENMTQPSQSPSRVSFTDARILFFPVRSLKGVIAWITCPYVLKRLKRDFEIFGKKLEFGVLNLNENEAMVPKESELSFEHGSEGEGNEIVVFEDFRLEKKEGFNVDVFEELLPDSIDFELFRKHAALVSDDVFKDLTMLGAEITPRIRINKETGTVAKGALWYEENVPAEAVFYSLMITEEGTEDFIKDEVIQVGGNGSTGHGIFKIKLVKLGG